MRGARKAMLIKQGDSPGDEQFINITAINPGSPEQGAAVSRSHSPATISRSQPPNERLMYSVEGTWIRITMVFTVTLVLRLMLVLIWVLRQPIHADAPVTY